MTLAVIFACRGISVTIVSSLNISSSLMKLIPEVAIAYILRRYLSMISCGGRTEIRCERHGFVRLLILYIINVVRGGGALSQVTSYDCAVEHIAAGAEIDKG